MNGIIDFFVVGMCKNLFSFWIIKYAL